MRSIAAARRPIRFERGANVVAPAALADLYRAVGWRRGGEPPEADELERLGRLIAGSAMVASAWDGPLLVGFGRCLTDGAFIGYINNLAVRPQYWRRGIGRRLVDILTAPYPEVMFMVSAVPEVAPFFEHLGYKAYETVWMAHDPQKD